jgi:hypothetical protein
MTTTAEGAELTCSFVLVLTSCGNHVTEITRAISSALALRAAMPFSISSTGSPLSVAELSTLCLRLICRMSAVPLSGSSGRFSTTSSMKLSSCRDRWHPSERGQRIRALESIRLRPRPAPTTGQRGSMRTIGMAADCGRCWVGRALHDAKLIHDQISVIVDRADDVILGGWKGHQDFDSWADIAPRFESLTSKASG